MTWDLRVGMKMVCINDDWMPLLLPWVVAPVKDVVYTIRAIEVIEAFPFLRLAEIVNTIPDDYLFEIAFRATHFRPLTGRKTDISVFERLLAPTVEVHNG